MFVLFTRQNPPICYITFTFVVPFEPNIQFSNLLDFGYPEDNLLTFTVKESQRNEEEKIRKRRKKSVNENHFFCGGSPGFARRDKYIKVCFTPSQSDFLAGQQKIIFQIRVEQLTKLDKNNPAELNVYATMRFGFKGQHDFFNQENSYTRCIFFI